MTDRDGMAARGRGLGVVGLGLVILSATDSIRNLPTTATFGWATILLYGVAIVTFLVPVAFCSAELATGWPGRGGGVYRWVREAFGTRWGLLAVWCDWSENVVWFPTVLVFLASTTAYVFAPSLATNKVFLVCIMLGIFWGATLAAFAGSLQAARWTGIVAFVGTAVPTLLVIGLGGWWLSSGRHSQVPFGARHLLPAWHGLQSLVYVAGIVVAFSGLEIGGYYARETRNPRRTYPTAVLGAAAIVAALSILGSVAIAVVVPRHNLELSSGVMQALTTMLDNLGIGGVVRPVGLLVLVGVVASLTAWAVGPAIGMSAVAEQGRLPAWMGRTNTKGAPVSMLLLQAIVSTALTLLLLFVHSINTYYWMLTALVAQTFIVMYLLMYASVFWLRRTQPDAPRPFRIPGGRIGLYLVVGAGVAGALFAFVLGFIPPNPLSTGETVAYVAVMLVGFLAIFLTPFFLHQGDATSAAEAAVRAAELAGIEPSTAALADEPPVLPGEPAL